MFLGLFSLAAVAVPYTFISIARAIYLDVTGKADEDVTYFDKSWTLD